MNGVVAFFINYVAKNPQVVETLITALVDLFAKNPPLLHAAVTVGIKKVDATLPATVAIIK